MHKIKYISNETLLLDVIRLYLLIGNEHGQGFRDRHLETEIHKLTKNTGIGAQFGGRYFCHDVRVIRLPRHGASCPVGIGVSCSADRQVSLLNFIYYTI